MVLEKAQTPEKQLLNIIENPAGQRHKGPAPHGRKVWFWPVGLARRGASGTRSKRYLPAGLSVKTINILLAVCIVGVVVYLGISSYVALNAIGKKLNLQATVRQAYAGAGQGDDPFKKQELRFFLAKLEARDIFQMGPRIKSDRAEADGTAVSSKLMEATKDLRLVGISWSENPDVMIEDVGRKVTYYLKQTELMESGVTIKDVFKDRVVLELGGETIELQ